jgi:thiamine-phosphate diphosphorylase
VLFLGRDCPILMAIVGAAGENSAAEAIQGGADFVQVRAKELSSAELVNLVRRIVTRVGGGKRIIVNGRPDVAEVSGARGVHLPENGLDAGLVRRAFPRLLVGVSRHDRAGLDRAADAGADYALLGPVFATPGKEALALGVPRWTDCAASARLAVFAVGGVDVESAHAVLEGGASGIAAIRPFEDDGRCRARAAALRKALDDADRTGTHGKRSDG